VGGCPDLVIGEQGQLGAEGDVDSSHGFAAEATVPGDPGGYGFAIGAETATAGDLVAASHLKRYFIVGAAEVEGAANEAVFVAEFAGRLYKRGPSFGSEFLWNDGVGYLQQGTAGDLERYIDLGSRERGEAVGHVDGGGGGGADLFGRMAGTAGGDEAQQESVDGESSNGSDGSDGMEAEDKILHY